MAKREYRPRKQGKPLAVYASDEVKQKLQAYARRIGISDSAAASEIVARAFGIVPAEESGRDDAGLPIASPATPRGASEEKQPAKNAKK